MNTEFTLKNFRVFDEDGVTMQIKPITLLTGCNSSGKSSIVKSMVLLDEFLTNLRNTPGYLVNKIEPGLDFYNNRNVSLGNFNRILHRNSTSKLIEYTLTHHSLCLGEDIKVSLVFGTNADDDLNNGHLKSFTIRNLAGETIFHSDEKISEGNFNLIINNYYRYVLGDYLICSIQSFQQEELRGVYNDDRVSEEAYISEIKEFYKSHFGMNSLQDIKFRKGDYSKIESLLSMFLNEDVEYFIKSNEKKTLFYLPIFDKFEDVTKADINNEFGIYENDLDEKDQMLIHHVIDDFSSSEHETFGDYFRAKEKEFLHYKNKKVGPIPFRETDFELVYLLWKSDEGKMILECMPADEYKESMSINMATLLYVLDLIAYLKGEEKSPYSFMSAISNNYFVNTLKIFEMFKNYVSALMLEVKEVIPKNLSYISSSVVDIRRLYSLESDEPISILLKNYFDTKKAYLSNKEKSDTFTPGMFINKWIQKLGIGYALRFNVNKDGLGVTIRLYRNQNDEEGSLLAEQGYGITQLFVVLLRIETSIMSSETYFVAKDDDYLGHLYNLPDEGKTLMRKAATLAIEEPEVHQHPKFQSMLAEIFVDAYKNYNVHFIIETHSEYIVRKLQLLVAKHIVDREDISILYVYNKDDKPLLEPQVKQIEIRKNGMLDGTFGEGFFDEADMLTMFLLTAGKEDNE